MMNQLGRRTDSVWTWLGVYALLLLIASAASVAAITALAGALGVAAGREPGPPLLIDASSLSFRSSGKKASQGLWYLSTRGQVGGYVRFERGGPSRVSILTQGTPVDGVWPQMRLMIDDQAVGGVQETGPQWTTSSWTVPISAGVHKIAVRYVNDAVAGGEDRNLLVRALVVRAVSGSAAPRLATRAEWAGASLTVPADQLAVSGVDSKLNPDGDYLLPTKGSVATHLRFSESGDYDIGVLTQGTPVDGVWPKLRLVVDDQIVPPDEETGPQWTTSSWTVPISAGVHKIAVRYVNDAVAGGEDRNLLVRALVVRAVSGSAAPRLATHVEWAGAVLTVPADELEVSGVGAKLTPEGDYLLPAKGSVATHARLSGSGDYDLSIIAQGTPVDGVWPKLRLVVDDQVIEPDEETGGDWTTSSWTVLLSTGVHKIAVRYVNDAVSGDEDRNLLVRALVVRAVSGSAAPTLATPGEWRRSLPQ